MIPTIYERAGSFEYMNGHDSAQMPNLLTFYMGCFDLNIKKIYGYDLTKIGTTWPK